MVFGSITEGGILEDWFPVESSLLGEFEVFLNKSVSEAGLRDCCFHVSFESVIYT